MSRELLRLSTEWLIAYRDDLGADVPDDLNDMIARNQAELTKQEADRPCFQKRVLPWLLECFGEEISNDKVERNLRFIEESIELVQSCGCTASEAHQIVDYVYSRPIGETHQEVGGVMVTLAALCLAQSIDMQEAGETDLARIWTKVEKIREKQSAKPKHSPLPIAKPEAEPVAQVVEYSKFTDVEWISDIPPEGTLLYTLPRSMQRLTDDEIFEKAFESAHKIGANWVSMDFIKSEESGVMPLANAIMDAMLEKNK